MIILKFSILVGLIVCSCSCSANPNRINLTGLGVSIHERDIEEGRRTIDFSFDTTIPNEFLVGVYIIHSRNGKELLKSPMFLLGYTQKEKFKHSFTVSDDILNSLSLELFYSVLNGSETVRVRSIGFDIGNGLKVTVHENLGSGGKVME